MPLFAFNNSTALSMSVQPVLPTPVQPAPLPDLGISCMAHIDDAKNNSGCFSSAGNTTMDPQYVSLLLQSLWDSRLTTGLPLDPTINEMYYPIYNRLVELNDFLWRPFSVDHLHSITCSVISTHTTEQLYQLLHNILK